MTLGSSAPFTLAKALAPASMTTAGSDAAGLCRAASNPVGSIGINSGKHDGGVALSFDGMTLYFHAAQRLGNGCPNASTCFFDIWMSTRTKLPDQQ